MSSVKRKPTQLSPLEIRPLWRRALVFAGAVLLLLAGIGFCIGSQRNGARFQSGIAMATPNTQVFACEASRAGIRLFYYKGQPSGIPLKQERVSFAGCGVSINTRLQGTDTNIFAPWWLIIALLSVLVAFAARDMGAGMRQARNDRLGRCTSCGYDLRATPERCPECGATPHKHALQWIGRAEWSLLSAKWLSARPTTEY